MNLSKEIETKIKVFAKEQAKHYFREAESQYLEKGSKVFRRKLSAEQKSKTLLEVEDDLTLYTIDVMAELVAKGLSEEEAFEVAKEKLGHQKFDSKLVTIQKKAKEYYQKFHISDFTAFGILFVSLLIAGSVLGILIGFIAGGGKESFLEGGWIDTLIGLFAGATIAFACGMIIGATKLWKKKQE
ncbi:MAG: hypothetical protein GX149_01200 [Acholeplasmataceae bacterium]|jgi:hypothetical protein|nr:hypothetical protein [Acholeplasmataceae bacterium]